MSASHPLLDRPMNPLAASSLWIQGVEVESHQVLESSAAHVFQALGVVAAVFSARMMIANHASSPVL